MSRNACGYIQKALDWLAALQYLTKAQKVEVNESDSFCHQNSVTCMEWKKDSCREGQGKKETENQGETTFYDYSKDFPSFNSFLICVRMAALMDIKMWFYIYC